MGMLLEALNSYSLGAVLILEKVWASKLTFKGTSPNRVGTSAAWRLNRAFVTQLSLLPFQHPCATNITSTTHYSTFSGRRLSIQWHHQPDKALGRTFPCGVLLLCALQLVALAGKKTPTIHPSSMSLKPVVREHCSPAWGRPPS